MATAPILAVDIRGAGDGTVAWVLPVTYLSASSLKMAMRCPRQWQERYIAGRKEKPGAAATLGTAEWGAHVLNYQQKMKTGEDLPDIDDAYATSWDEAVAKNGGVNEIQWNSDTKWAEVQTLGREMARVYHAQVSPRTQPIAVEQKIEFPMPGLPVPILGYIDLTKLETTVEHKTGKSLTKPKMEWLFQQRIYSAHTRMPGEIHLVTKAKQPKVVTPLESPDMFVPVNDVQIKATEKLVAKAAWTLNFYYATYGPDEPWPQHGVIHDWACNWCAYRGDCPAWRTT